MTLNNLGKEYLRIAQQQLDDFEAGNIWFNWTPQQQLTVIEENLNYAKVQYDLETAEEIQRLDKLKTTFF